MLNFRSLTLVILAPVLLTLAGSAHGTENPVANPDYVNVPAGSTNFIINVLANDLGPGLHITAVTQGAHGTVVTTDNAVFPNSTYHIAVLYSPTGDYTGQDYFTYTITDSNNLTATGNVYVTVIIPNPVANPDQFAVPENSLENVLDVLHNDLGPGLHITATTPPGHGTANINLDGTRIIYTPAQNYFGPDQFNYTITDANTHTAGATVYVSVIGTTTLPPPPPVANPDYATVPQNSPGNLIDVLHNDLGLGLHITAVTPGEHGAVSVTSSATVGSNTELHFAVLYTPAPDYTGPDHFTYTITDANSATAVGNVYVSVIPPNPIANPDQFAVPENSLENVLDVLHNDKGLGLHITATTPPGHGTANINPDGTRIIYTPAQNYFGPDQFNYTITDANNHLADAGVYISVNAIVPPIILPPVANPDYAKIPQDSSNNLIDVLHNDLGIGLHISAFTQGEHGAVSVTTSAIIPNTDRREIVLYTPAPGYFGPDHFGYTITDVNGLTASTTVYVAVISNNPPPVANPDFATVLQNSLANEIDVLNNDNGTGLMVTLVSQGAHGTVAIPDIGASVLYTPNADYIGPDHFSYQITDANGLTATGFVGVAVVSANPPPVANPDYAEVPQNSAANKIDVLHNDIGIGLLVTAVTQSEHGSVAIPDAANAALYTPAPNYFGPDRFSYTITDANGATAVGYVAVAVINPNPGPIANPDYVKVPENSVNNPINVLANDLGPGLHVVDATQGEHGSVAINAGGTGVTYSPAANYAGTDHFNYTVADTYGRTAVGFVGVAVHPPITIPPVAGPDFTEIPENSDPHPIDVLHNDLGVGLHITAVTQGANGAVAIIQEGLAVTYTPAANYVGEDHFTYTITDANGATATGYVGIAVFNPNPGPIANHDYARVAKNSVDNLINVLANDKGIGLTITAVTQGDHGAVSVTTSALATNTGLHMAVLYTPDVDFTGEDHFTYTITDANSATATGTVSVLVIDPNAGPLAFPDYATVAENSPGTAIDVLHNDVGTGLFVSAVTQGAHGSVDIGIEGLNVIYTPADNYAGPDQFSYTITDANNNSATAPVYIRVVNPNPGPIANPDYALVPENSDPNRIEVLHNDVGDQLAVVEVTQGAHGTVAITDGGGAVTYTPDADFVGPDSFLYTILDSHGAHATGYVGIAVLSTHPIPIANPDFVTLLKNSPPVPIDVLHNDLGEGLHVTAVTQPEHGSVAIGPEGRGVICAVNADFTGIDHFKYTITDVNGATASASVGVYVINGLPGPVANPDFATLPKGSPAKTINVLANDLGDGLTVTAVTNGEHGSAAIADGGADVTYTPNPDYAGPDHFNYTITDGNGHSATGNVYVLVTNPVRHSLVDAIASPNTIHEGESVSFDVLVQTTIATANLKYAWNFGDGSNSSDKSPSHAYASAGAYVATVTVFSSNTPLGTSSITIHVLGAGVPTARFTTSDVVGFVGLPLTFDATFSTDPENALAAFSWDFGDGSPAGSSMVISKIYNAPGAYKVKLTVTDAQGLTGGKSRTIQVLPADAVNSFKSHVHYDVRLNFGAPGADSLNVEAIMNVGDLTVAAGTTVGFEIAGQSFTGTLDNTLRDLTHPNVRWQVRAGTTSQSAGDVAIKLRVKRASLGASFAAAGVVPGTNPTAPVTVGIPVTISVGDQSVELVIDSSFDFSSTGARARGAGDGP